MHDDAPMCWTGRPVKLAEKNYESCGRPAFPPYSVGHSKNNQKFSLLWLIVK
jgi:hypothetical protein